MLSITNHKEMQIKTTRHYFTPIRLAIIKTNTSKKQEITSVGKDMGNWNL